MVQPGAQFRVVWKEVGGPPETRECDSRFEVDTICESMEMGAFLQYMYVEQRIDASQWTKVARVESGWTSPGRPLREPRPLPDRGREEVRAG
jgi:hypothetical protein